LIDPAHELRTFLRQAAGGRDLSPVLFQLERLLDAALDQAELRGIRLVARTVPHELAQPLAEVRGYAELLTEDDYPEEQAREFLELIAAAATRAGNLAHTIGRLGRPDEPPPQRRSMGGEELLALPSDAAEPADLPETATAEHRRSRLRRIGPEEPAF
jgi:signal transduction histidine kinase